MKLRRVGSIITAACLGLSLVACGGGTSATSSSAAESGSTSAAASEASSSSVTSASASGSTETSSASVVAGSTGGTTTTEDGRTVAKGGVIDFSTLTGDNAVGTINETGIDYKSGKKYKFVFLSDDDQLLQQQMFTAYQSLQDKYNFEVEYLPSGGSDDEFVQNLQMLVDRGDVDGLILETGSYMGDVCLPILEKSGIPWINQFTEFYDKDGNVATPTCIIPQYQSGWDSLEWICQNYKNYWGDVDKNEIGLINLDFSTSAPLHDRTIGITDCFKNYITNSDSNIFVVDTYALGQDHWMTMQGGYDPVSTTVSSHPEIKYWMVSSCLEYYAQGAARAAEDLGLNDNMLISDVGSPMFEDEVANGYEGAWKCCVCINNYAYATPIVLGLRAICDGRATEETLWPSLHNYFSDNDKYGTWRAEYKVVTADDYQEYEDEIQKKYGP
jgi:hypothetical protein